jgi:hypothetical protein
MWQKARGKVGAGDERKTMADGIPSYRAFSPFFLFPTGFRVWSAYLLDRKL